MCRISLFNKKGFDLIEEKYGIEKFLYRLEKEQGGSGNGIALSKNGKVFFMRKGLGYRNSTIVKHLRTMDWDWCLYHTRIASMGVISDKNCHPFKEGDTILAMNGTESGYKGLADALKITDTQAVLLTVKRFNLDLFDTLKGLSSNFIGFKDGKAFATSPNNWKSYEIAKDDDGAIVISSSLPIEFDKYEPLGKPFVWTEGEELKVVKKKEVVYITTAGAQESTVKSWTRSIISGYDYRDYCCPSCIEIIRGIEIIHDNGDMYCPMCGEEIRPKDRLSRRYAFD